MPKINAFSIPGTESERREVALVTKDGQKDTLVLLEPDLATRLRAREVTDELWEMYGREDGPAFPCPGLKPSRTLFAAAALVCEMQEEPVYSAVDLVILFWKEEDQFEKVQTAVNELGRATENRRKN